jgi:B12-binding domain/radical SAM domain protein
MIKLPVIQNKKKKRRIIFRLSPFNRLSFPVLLNAWEQEELDREFEIVPREEPLSAREVRRGDVILFSFMTSVFPIIHKEIREIRSSQAGDLLIAAGGPHVTGDRELPFEAGIDVLFTGPAEENFIQFGRDLLDNKPLPAVYAYRYRPGLDDFNPYLPVSKYFTTVPPLEIMRGCHWHCKYCGTHLHRVRFRRLDSIDAYLQELKKRNLKRVNFISPSAMEYGAAKARRINLERIEALLELIGSYEFLFNEYGIFPSEVRPDTVTPEGMAVLKRHVINKSITMGAQSGLDQRLRQLSRGHSVEDIRRAVEIANAAGFRANLDFIVGYPDESHDERQTTIEFIKTLSRQYRIRTHLHHFIPLAGSPYAYRFPTFLPSYDKEQLDKLKDAGISSGGWLDNEKQAQDYFEWLKHYFPAYYSRYT